MKKLITLIALIASSLNAEVIDIPTKLVGGSISQVEVGDVRYNSDDNSWQIEARPVVSYPEPQQVAGVRTFVQIIVNLSIKVTRAEIETYLGIADVGTATVDQLNAAVRAVALSKANSALNP